MMSLFKDNRSNLFLFLIAFLYIPQIIYSQNCNAKYANVDATYNQCTSTPSGTQIMSFDGVGSGLTMGVWIQITAVPTATAYVMRLTLDSTDDAGSKDCKIVAIELTSSNKISIKFAGAGLILLGNRFDYEVASLSGYVLNKWYWIFATRNSALLTLLSGIQYAGIYDTQTSSWVVQEADNSWTLGYYTSALNSAGFMVFANGFRGFAQGFCGKIRGLSVMPGVELTFAQGLEYMAQRQGGGSINALLLYLPFDSNTGQVARDRSSNAYHGTFGSSTYTDSNDPKWETDLSKGLHFKNTGQPNYIKLPLFEFLGSDDSVTITFDITLESAPTCTAPIIQRKSATNVIVFGIVVKNTRAVWIIINNVELSLGITLTIGTTSTITVMCTNYGGFATPLCKAYNGNTKVLTLSTVAAASLGMSSTDQNFIGDDTCALNAYLSNIAIAKDGNILDVACSNCQLSISIDVTNSFCASCVSGQKGFQGTCIAACGTGFSLSAATGECYCPPGGYVNGNVCSACSSGCDGCTSSSATSCTSCSPSVSPTLYLSPSGSCAAACPTGSIPESDGQYCMLCDDACVHCTALGNTNCVAASGCRSGYYQQPSPDTTSCLASCPAIGYYPNSVTNKCESCHAYCQVCTGSTASECSQCNTGYYKSGSTACVTSAGCPSGTYPDSSTFICESCTSPCSTCTTTSATCTSCVAGYFLQPSPNNNQCLNSCPAGYYPNTATKNCEACMSPCMSCTGPTLADCAAGCPTECSSCELSDPSNCTACSAGYFLHDNQCLSSCPEYYYGDTSVRKCISCPAHCDSCGSSGCSACQNPRYLYDNTCLLSCPSNTYAKRDTSNYLCIDCDATCLTCTGEGPNNCRLCKGGLFLYNNKCVSKCPLGTYEARVNVTEAEILVPVCNLKVPLSMKLKLTTVDPRTVLILFSSSVGKDYLKIFSAVLRVKLQGTTVDTSLFSTSIENDATLKLSLLANNYIPNGALLEAELLLDSDFDSDTANEYTFPDRNAEISLTEYYPYSPLQQNTIAAASQTTNGAASAVNAAQTAAIVASGGLSFSLLQYKLAADLVQLLQYIDMDWPSNVADFFKSTHEDPEGFDLKFSFVPGPAEEDLPNITVSRPMEITGASPFFIENADEALTILSIVLGATVVVKLLLHFSNVKFIPQKLKNLETAADKMFAWNACLQMFISNFPPLFTAGLLQLYFYPGFESRYCTVGYILAIVAGISSLALIIFTMVMVRNYTKRIFDNKTEGNEKKTSEEMVEEADKIYERVAFLFEASRKDRKIHLYQIPLDLLRVFLIAVVAIALSAYAWVALITINVIQILYLFYLVRFRPFDDKFEQWLVVITELLIQATFICMLAIKIGLETGADAESLHRVGWGFVSLNMGISIITLVAIAKQLLVLLILFVKWIKPKIFGRKSAQKILPLAADNSAHLLKFINAAELSPGATADLLGSGVEICSVDKLNSTLKNSEPRSRDPSQNSLRDSRPGSLVIEKVKKRNKEKLKLQTNTETLSTPRRESGFVASPKIDIIGPDPFFPPSNPGTIFMDGGATSKHTVREDSSPDDRESSLQKSQLNTSQYDSTTKSGQNTSFRRYFFQIPQTDQNVNDNVVGSFSEQVSQLQTLKEEQLDAGKEAPKNDSKQVSPTASIFDRPTDSLFLRVKKSFNSAMLERKLQQQRMASMQILQSKKDLDNAK